MHIRSTGNILQTNRTKCLNTDTFFKINDFSGYTVEENINGTNVANDHLKTTSCYFF